ncbi:MAG TPA: hypothetical protein PKG81_07935, partial [Candidatus Omnitrophota bacterium]|nr:hypothetical protein [Candidatus Omnitrophota bacterium]
IMTFVKNRSDFKTAKKWVPGTILLISALILSRIGNSIGMAVEFWILSYLVGLLRKSYSVNPAIAAYNGKQIKITDGPIVLIIIFIIAVIVLLAAIAVPNFIRARETAMAKVCVSNLEQIQNAKIAWANNTKSEGMGIPTWKDLIPAYLKEEPKCPKEGKYSIGFVSSAPTCSVGNNNSRYPEMKHEIR